MSGNYHEVHALLQDKDMVPALLTMKAAMDSILSESFAKNDSFVMALKEAFEHFINQRQNKCAFVAAQQHKCSGHRHCNHGRHPTARPTAWSAT